MQIRITKLYPLHIHTILKRRCSAAFPRWPGARSPEGTRGRNPVQPTLTNWSGVTNWQWLHRCDFPVHFRSLRLFLRNKNKSVLLVHDSHASGSACQLPTFHSALYVPNLFITSDSLTWIKWIFTHEQLYLMIVILLVWPIIMHALRKQQKSQSCPFDRLGLRSVQPWMTVKPAA